MRYTVSGTSSSSTFYYDSSTSSWGGEEEVILPDEPARDVTVKPKKIPVGTLVRLIVPPTGRPAYNWGKTHSGDLGLVKNHGNYVYIHFPLNPSWKGLASEVEVANLPFGDVIGDTEQERLRIFMDWYYQNVGDITLVDYDESTVKFIINGKPCSLHRWGILNLAPVYAAEGVMHHGR